MSFLCSQFLENDDIRVSVIAQETVSQGSLLPPLHSICPGYTIQLATSITSTPTWLLISFICNANKELFILCLLPTTCGSRIRIIIRNLRYITTVPTGVLTQNGATPSADDMLNTTSDMVLSNCVGLLMISNRFLLTSRTIQNGWRNLARPCGARVVR